MSPIYVYIHPDSGEEFEEIRRVEDRNKPFTAPDGVKCKRQEVGTNIKGWNGKREVFEADPGYVKSCKPKYVKFQDGHKEKYDPTKHC